MQVLAFPTFPVPEFKSQIIIFMLILFIVVGGTLKVVMLMIRMLYKITS